MQDRKRDSCRESKNHGLHQSGRTSGAYCLKMDIKFYPSIDHDILFGIVRRKIKCPDTLWLLEDIIYSIPGDKNVPIKGIL